MNIALYGGSFDPPHAGHIAVVNEALKTLEIDKLIIVPVFQNPLKFSVYASTSQRLEWLHEIFSDYDRVEISNFEIAQNRSVYTIETVEHFSSFYDKIYLIIGADNVATLDRWRDIDRLKSMVSFVVAARGDIAIDDCYITLDTRVPRSSSDFRATLDTLGLEHKIESKILKYYKGKKMLKRVENITQILDENKAEAIEVFDLKGSSYIADAVVLATALNEKHTFALLDYLKKSLKPGEQFLHVDESGDWIAIDLGDILIHILTPSYRAKYDLESFLAEIAASK